MAGVLEESIFRLVAGKSMIIFALVREAKPSDMVNSCVASGFLVKGLTATIIGIRNIRISSSTVVLNDIDCPIKYSTPMSIKITGQKVDLIDKANPAIIFVPCPVFEVAARF